MKFIIACLVAQFVFNTSAFAKVTPAPASTPTSAPTLKDLCIAKVKANPNKKLDANKVCTCYVEKMSFIPKEDEKLLIKWIQNKTSSEEVKKKSHSLLDVNYHAESDCIEN